MSERIDKVALLVCRTITIAGGLFALFLLQGVLAFFFPFGLDIWPYFDEGEWLVLCLAALTVWLVVAHLVFHWSRWLGHLARAALGGMTAVAFACIALGRRLGSNDFRAGGTVWLYVAVLFGLALWIRYRTRGDPSAID